MHGLLIRLLQAFSAAKSCHCNKVIFTISKKLVIFLSKIKCSRTSFIYKLPAFISEAIKVFFLVLQFSFGLNIVSISDTGVIFKSAYNRAATYQLPALIRFGIQIVYLILKIPCYINSQNRTIFLAQMFFSMKKLSLKRIIVYLCDFFNAF